MGRERVVITGVGVVSAVFTGAAPAVGDFLAGPTRVLPAAGVTDEAMLAGLIEPTEGRRLSRVCRFGVAAARLALADARLDPDARLGVVVGTEFGDLRSTREFADGYLDRGPAGVSALLFPGTVMNTMASAISIAVRAREASLTLNTPCVSGELAVARAAAAVANGRLSAALAGGVDEADDERARIIEQLGRRVDGRGEGAVFLVLETRRAAERRGATVLGELTGWAWRGSGEPRRGVAMGAIVAATTAAGCAGRDLRWAYHRASGDAVRDRAEALALAQAFGRPRRVASLARAFGEHAGLGALRVAAASWTARAGLMPADGDTPAARVDHGPGLVHARAPGGTHVALIVSPGEAAA